MYFLGVDGGQSGTKAVIGDGAGKILGRGVAGPCNHVGAAEGRAKLEGALRGAVGAAVAEAGLAADVRFQAACFGMSGGPADKKAIIEELIPSGKTEVTTDAHIALDGALGGEPGAIVIAGTGSIALGRDAEGRTARAGGWGYLFGDEGGAFDIVRQALRAALRMEEGWGARTSLREAMLEETGAADINELMHWFYTDAWPRDRVARLLPLVGREAEQGDAVSDELLREAARSLADYLSAVRARLFAAKAAPPVSYVGGVFRNERVREAFADRLRTSCTVAAPRFGPSDGALLGAYRLGDVKVELQV